MSTVKYTISDPGFQGGKISIPKDQYEITIQRVTTVNGKSTTEVVQMITVHPQLYRKVLIAYSITLLVLLVVAGIFGDVGNEYGWGGAVIALVIAHVAFSFSNVKENERGGILFFGRPVKEVEQGLVFHPLGLLGVKKLPRNPIQVQFPGDPEKVYKGHDDQYFTLSKEEQERYVLPIRATTAAPAKKIKGEEGVLNTQMTLEVNFYVRWTVEQFWVFLVRIGGIEEEIRQFRDSGERVLIQEIATRTPAQVVRDLSVINEALARKFEEITQDSGVLINETAMLSPDINHQVNSSLRDVATAKAKSVKTMIDAAAEKVKLTLEGEGAAAAKAADYKAQAEGAKALGLKGQDILDLEKTKALANGNATIIVDGGTTAGGIVGLGTRLGIGMNQGKGT